MFITRRKGTELSIASCRDCGNFLFFLSVVMVFGTTPAWRIQWNLRELQYWQEIDLVILGHSDAEEALTSLNHS